jgi:hypothetical protein
VRATLMILILTRRRACKAMKSTAFGDIGLPLNRGWAALIARGPSAIDAIEGHSQKLHGFCRAKKSMSFTRQLPLRLSRNIHIGFRRMANVADYYDGITC